MKQNKLLLIKVPIYDKSANLRQELKLNKQYFVDHIPKFIKGKVIAKCRRY